MHVFDYVNITGRFMEWENPISLHKMTQAGALLNLQEGSRVIDFGCGYGEILALWAERFGIHGVGVEVRPYACERAEAKMRQRGVADRVEIVCASGAEYEFQPGSFDLAICLGATFIWGGYAGALQAMQQAVHPTGRLAIGEEYWLSEAVPTAYLRQEEGALQEWEILAATRQAGWELSYVVRASRSDWDRYEGDRWQGALHWLQEHPQRPEREDVLARLRRGQDAYLTYGRAYMGWAVYLLQRLAG